jgi:DnaA family protein
MASFQGQGKRFQVTDRRIQLPIPLHRHELSNFENFHVGENAQLVDRLRGLASGVEATGLWLWGPTGRGRSHLLQATCQAAEAAGRRVVYLPLESLPVDPAVLEELEVDLVALDDVDRWLGDRALETQLMALYQNQLMGGGSLLVVAAAGAQQLSFGLPDLASRLRALPGFEVQPPDDEGLKVIIARLAARQGLELEPAVLDFWFHRAVRALPALIRQLEKLDRAAMIEQRRLTIPLIKEVLGL